MAHKPQEAIPQIQGAQKKKDKATPKFKTPAQMSRGFSFLKIIFD